MSMFGDGVRHGRVERFLFCPSDGQCATDLVGHLRQSIIFRAKASPFLLRPDLLRSA